MLFLTAIGLGDEVGAEQCRFKFRNPFRIEIWFYGLPRLNARRYRCFRGSTLGIAFPVLFIRLSRSLRCPPPRRR
jgi:hypothetical protein